MTPAERIARLDAMIAEDRIIRGAWTSGRERACLLAALSPEAGEAEDAEACPAEVMAKWLAHLTPWIDDSVSEEAWRATVLRYATAARRWHLLSEEDWVRLDYAARAIAVREAMTHTTDPAALAACKRVVALCDRRAGGDIPTEDEWRAAAEAAAWAETAERAARAARAVAAEVAAADRIAAGVLGAIEVACDRAEARS